MTRHPHSLPAVTGHAGNRIPAALGLLPGVLACILFCVLLWAAPAAQAKDVSVLTYVISVLFLIKFFAVV